MNDKDYYQEIFERSFDRLLRIMAALLLASLACAVISTLTGCKTTYVPVETVRTEHIVNTVHDSILVNTGKTDSIVLHEKGDTVFLERWHTEWKDRWRDRCRTDTLIRSDTIRVPYPVEGRVPRWEKARLAAMGAAGTAGVMAAVGVALWLRHRYKRC